VPVFDPSTVTKKLEALRAKDEKLRVFGANGHRWKLARKLTERDVSAVEKQYGVELPDDYRAFLLAVGAGGAGPAYGIFPLVHARTGGWCWDGDGATLTGDLETPFPHAKPWNMTFPEWDEEAEAEDDYWARRDAWDRDVYFHPKQTTGAICICHEGCALRDWLVVTGPQRGKMWSDERADGRGLIPLKKTFGEWYLAWLAKAARVKVA
jgi:hypothetical protein